MPVEYGLAVVGWGAEFSGKEIYLDGTDHTRGLHTWFGSEEERERNVSNGMPYLLQSYDTLATNMLASEQFNVIHQRAGNRQIYEDVVRYNSMANSLDGNMNSRLAEPQPIYDPSTGQFLPGTYLTFCHATGEVKSIFWKMSSMFNRILDPYVNKAVANKETGISGLRNQALATTKRKKMDMIQQFHNSFGPPSLQPSSEPKAIG